MNLLDILQTLTAPGVIISWKTRSEKIPRYGWSDWNKKKLKKSGRKEKNELAHFEECLTVPDILVSFGFNLLCFESNTKIQ